MMSSQLIRFLLITYVFSGLSLFAQPEDCPCCTTEHRGFDFWLGDWVVYDTLGNPLGENLVTKLENNCIVSEKWTSSQGGGGRSFNYYDPVDSTWNQLWIDSRGGHLQLKGKASDGKMVLQGPWVKGQQVDSYANRITWTAMQDESVRQQWDIVDPHNKVMNTVFVGIYRLRDP